jgi:hypothetical protein
MMKKFRNYSRNIYGAGRWTANLFYVTKTGSPYTSVIVPLYLTMVALPQCGDPIKAWRELYLSALVEIDPAKLKRKAEIALLAVQQHTQELKIVLATPHSEQQSLRDAASALQSLMKSS